MIVSEDFKNSLERQIDRNQRYINRNKKHVEYERDVSEHKVLLDSKSVQELGYYLMHNDFELLIPFFSFLDKAQEYPSFVCDTPFDSRDQLQQIFTPDELRVFFKAIELFNRKTFDVESLNYATPKEPVVSYDTWVFLNKLILTDIVIERHEIWLRVKELIDFVLKNCYN